MILLAARPGKDVMLYYGPPPRHLMEWDINPLRPRRPLRLRSARIKPQSTPGTQRPGNTLTPATLRRINTIKLKQKYDSPPKRAVINLRFNTE